jgi:hypothetical protein
MKVAACCQNEGQMCEFPVNFPVSREFCCRDWFDRDCVVSQPVRSPRAVYQHPRQICICPSSL